MLVINMKAKELLNIYRNYAVIGVSENKEKFGYKIYKRLKEREYHVYGVSPIYQSVANDKLYPNLESIPAPIDVVVFVVSPKHVKYYVDEMRNIGIGYAWMQPGTYTDETIEYIESHGIKVIKDCILIQTEND